MKVSIEFSSALEDAARGIDTAAWVRDSPELQDLMGKLQERGLPEPQSQRLCERFVRAIVGFVGREVGAGFDDLVGRLMDVQGRIMQLYRTALEANRLSDDFAGTLRRLLGERESLFNELREAAQRAQTDPLQNERVTLEDVIGAEEAGVPVDSLPGEDPGEVELGGDHPNRPRTPERYLRNGRLTPAAQQLAAVVEAARARMKIPNDVQIEWGPMLGSDASRTAQFRGLRLLDADFAGRGVEAVFTLGGGDRFQIDGLVRDPGMPEGHFRLGDFKADLAPEAAPSYYERLEPYSQGEVDFRFQLKRLLYLRERLPTCEGITYLTNSERNAAALRAVIQRVADIHELPYVEVRWAP